MPRRRAARDDDSSSEDDGYYSSSSSSSSASSSNSLSEGEVAYVAKMLERRRRKKLRGGRRHRQQKKGSSKKTRSEANKCKRQKKVAAAAQWPPPPRATASSRSGHVEDLATTGGGVYALQTLSGDAPAFYVGKSSNIEKRLQDHRNGVGTPYLAGCDFVEVPLCTDGSPHDLESWERNETLQRMLEFGVDNVRGWMFTDRHLQPADRRAAFVQICEKNDLCRRCGRASHFRSSCFAKSTAPWANGLPLNA